MITPSERCYTLIKNNECAGGKPDLVAYLCPANKWTIGYGHTGKDVRRGMTITKERAHELLVADVAIAARSVRRAIGKRPITQSQLDAFVSLCFNIGAANFETSTAVKRHNAGDYIGAADALTWFKKATVNGKKVTLPGLVKRRAQEKAMYLEDTPITQSVLPNANSNVTRPETASVPATESKPITTNAATAVAVTGGSVVGATVTTEVTEAPAVEQQPATVSTATTQNDLPKQHSDVDWSFVSVVLCALILAVLLFNIVRGGKDD